WSLTSGGTGGACIPTVNNDVFFDGSSFIAGGSTVTTATGNAYCRNMDWTGAINNPVFDESPSLNMEVWGDLTLNPAVTMNTLILLKGATNNMHSLNGSNLGDYNFTIMKPGGSNTAAGDLSNSNNNIVLTSGSLDLSNKNINVEFSDDGGTAQPTTLNISNA